MAYDNNINPGNPPLVWSRIREAFDKVNENFSIIGSTLARETAYDIINIDNTNPVRVVVSAPHSYEDGMQATITSSGVSQLDTNTYYIKVVSDDEVDLYTDATLSTTVDGTAFDSYPSSGGQLQALSEYASLDFEAMTTSISPKDDATYFLGSTTKTWKRIYASEYSDVPGNEFNGVWLGEAQIKGIDQHIDLPLDSTVNGELIIDPNKTFFKSVQVDNGNRVVADEFIDTLNFISGTAISMTVDSSAESVTINNTGVTQLTAGTGLTVSASTGNITVNNTGVIGISNGTSLPAIASGRSAGVGIITNSVSGTLTLTNTGVIEVQAGSGITTFTDTATGIVTITNAAPAGNAFRFVTVFGQSAIEADGVADTIEFVEGYGITLTTDAPNDKLTIAFDNNVDIVGSVFADDSSKMVDAVENEMYASGGFFGNLTGNVTGNITGNVTGNVTGDLTGNSTGYHTGDVKGSVFGDDSSLIVDAVDNKVYADEIITPQIIATTSFGLSTGGLTSISTNDNIELNATSGAIYANTTLFDITGPLTVSGTISGNVTGNLTGNSTGYHTGDVTGSVFADDSTMLVDATNAVLRGTHIGDVNGSVFGDDSTLLVNGIDGTLAYYPTTPSDWDGDAPTTVGEALDRLATLIKTLNAGTGA